METDAFAAVYKNNPCYVNGVSEKLFNQGLCIPAGPWVTDKGCSIYCETN